MRKRISVICLPIVILVMTLSGCDDPQYPTSNFDDGTLALSDFTLTVSSDEETAVDVSHFVVNVFDEHTGDLAATWTYDKVPEYVELPEGMYVVEAYNAEVQPAAWDAPYYYGSTQVRVYGKEATVVAPLQCSLANVKVDVSYTDAFRAAMGDDVTVKVEVQQGASLDFVPDETRSAYFEAGATTLVATLTGTVGGVGTMIRQVLTDISAGRHYQVTFALDDEQ